MSKFIYKFEVMTTPCEVIIYHNDKNKADKCANDILNEAKRLEFKYNYFSTTSILHSINTRNIDVLDNETKQLLHWAKKYAKFTNNIFDITIATIKDLYKNIQNIEELNKQIEILNHYVGCQHFVIKRDKIKFDNKFTKIDFGGMVKEYAVDRAVKILQKDKINTALINFGGDIYAHGRKPNGEKFSIGIKNPNKSQENIEVVTLENEALTTSASYERNKEIEGKFFSHIIGAKSDIISATVISKSCLRSGIFSTSLMIDKNLQVEEKYLLIDKNSKVIKSENFSS